MTEIMKIADAKALYAEQYGVTKKQAEEELKRVADFVQHVVTVEQQGIKLGDVGTFKVQVKEEREYNKPGTDEKVIKPKHYALKFQVNAQTKRELEEYTFED